MRENNLPRKMTVGLLSDEGIECCVKPQISVVLHERYGYMHGLFLFFIFDKYGYAWFARPFVDVEVC